MTKSEILKTAKPILFNTEMVMAILNGKKTVTRRILKTSKYIPDDAKFGYTAFTPTKHISVRGHFANNKYGESFIKLPCQPDDILYVRETYSFLPCSECEKGCLTLGLQDAGCYIYKADKKQDPYEKWRPSIHMPKEAARLFLRVKDVRVERLQDITTIDTYKEGISECMIDPNCVGTCDDCMQKNSPLHRFERLWNGTLKKSDIGKYCWNANPWVWVIEFERVEVQQC